MAKACSCFNSEAMTSSSCRAAGMADVVLKKLPKDCLARDLIGENEEDEKLDEEEKHHVKTREKPLSGPQTKQKDLKKIRDQKYFTCTQCGKSLTSKKSLEFHMIIHTGEKPHECDQCGKTFLCASSLKNHLKVHSKEKPHSCSVCGKSFSRLQSLKAHQKRHTGVRDHCTVSLHCVREELHSFICFTQTYKNTFTESRSSSEPALSDQTPHPPQT